MWARVVGDIQTDTCVIVKGDVVRIYEATDQWCIIIRRNIAYYVYSQDFKNIVQGPYEVILSTLLESIYDICS